MAEHHGITGYSHGCRCEECRTAWNAYNRDYQRRWRALRNDGEHPNAHQRWIERDVMSLRWMWPRATVPDIARALGRSCSSVTTMASKLGLKRNEQEKGQKA